MTKSVKSRNIAIATGFIILALIVYFLSDLVAFVLIAWVISILGQPVMNFYYQYLRIGRWHAGPSVCALLTIFTFILFLALIISIFVPLIISQANNLANMDYQEMAKTLEKPFAVVDNWAHDWGLIPANQTATEKINYEVTRWFQPSRVTGFFSSLINTIGNVLFAFTAISFTAFFFLKDSKMFNEILMAIVPNEYEKKMRITLQEISRMLTRYFGGVFLEIVFVTLFVTITLTILGVKNALLIGIFAALMNVIPYVGPFIGAIFGVLITVSSNLDMDLYSQLLPQILKVVGTMMVMQWVDNLLVQPTIFSNSVNAHPLEIFLIIIIGAKVGGITGMVIAIPAYTTLRVVARSFLSQFKVIRKLTDSLEDSTTTTSPPEK